MNNNIGPQVGDLYLLVNDFHEYKTQFVLITKINSHVVYFKLLCCNKKDVALPEYLMTILETYLITHISKKYHWKKSFKYMKKKKKMEIGNLYFAIQDHQWWGDDESSMVDKNEIIIILNIKKNNHILFHSFKQNKHLIWHIEDLSNFGPFNGFYTVFKPYEK